MKSGIHWGDEKTEMARLSKCDDVGVVIWAALFVRSRLLAVVLVVVSTAAFLCCCCCCRCVGDALAVTAMIVDFVFSYWKGFSWGFRFWLQVFIQLIHWAISFVYYYLLHSGSSLFLYSLSPTHTHTFAALGLEQVSVSYYFSSFSLVVLFAHFRTRHFLAWIWILSTEIPFPLWANLISHFFAGQNFSLNHIHTRRWAGLKES